MTQKIDGFFSQYPKKVKELLRFLCSQNLELYLVGGAVRDFLDSGTFGKDHDFEIQSSLDLAPKEWETHVDAVMAKAAGKFGFSVEKLKFHIHRLNFKDEEFDYDLEFAPARLEVYDKDQKFYGHSDFKVQLLPQVPVKECWLRRDFSVNTLGMHFNLKGPRSELELIDPFQGLTDLKQRTLRPVGPDFHRDPVRFVRSLRFARKLKMNFGSELKNKLGLFNLKLLSREALKRESIKDGRPIDFLVKFFQLARTYNVELPVEFNDLQAGVEKIEGPGLEVSGPPDLKQSLSWLWNPGFEWSEAEFLSFALFWGGKKKQVAPHFKIYEILVELPKGLLSLSSGEELRRHPHFGQLKKLVDFFESTHWPLFREAIPSETGYSWPRLLQQLDPDDFKAVAKKHTQNYEGPEKGIQKLLCFLECLRGLHD